MFRTGTVESAIGQTGAGGNDRPTAGWRRFLAWLPLFLLVLTGVLWATEQQKSYESPFLRLALNFLFSTLVSVFIAYLVGRSFLASRTPGLLLLGCGVVFMGPGGFASSIVSNMNPSLGVTVHNVCVWLSAVCHLTGVALTLRPGRAMRPVGLWLAAGYACSLSALALVTWATLAGWMPIFFVPGSGGTPVRYAVLGSAIIMFGVTAALLGLPRRRPLSEFAHWYGLALALTATGLLGVMAQSTLGSPLSWVGRATQYLGGVYMLIAAVASARESREWGIPLEAALSAVRQQYDKLFDLAADGIVVHEPVTDTARGAFTQANLAMCGLLGYSLQEMRALTMLDLTAPEDRHTVALDSETLRRNGALRHEKNLLAKDGRRIAVDINTRLFEQHGRWMAMSAIRDITDRRRVEEQIDELYRDAQQEIERRNQLELQLRAANEDLQEFASAISHDLQSPMNGVISMAELLREECGGMLGRDGDVCLSHITQALERMRRMILDLLAYSRAAHDDQTRHELVDLGQALERANLSLSARIHENQAMITHDPLPEVEGNFVCLAQLFQNLIENAIKYRTDERPHIHVSSEGQGEEWAICVSDNGIGIDSKYAEHIFGIFKRLHGSEFEGTGIGLSLCRRIVENHGGQIWVESSPGEGARFFFTLPQAAQEGAKGAA
jgi:PAS domain S-box-containing protein